MKYSAQVANKAISRWNESRDTPSLVKTVSEMRRDYRSFKKRAERLARLMARIEQTLMEDETERAAMAA
jgi:hypothetical protein